MIKAGSIKCFRLFYFKKTRSTILCIRVLGLLFLSTRQYPPICPFLSSFKPFCAIVCYCRQLWAVTGKRVRTVSQLCTRKRMKESEKITKQIKRNERMLSNRTSTKNSIRTLSGQIKVKTVKTNN